MIDLKTLNSLDSMSKYKTYSKYNDLLEKKFKGYSLKSLIKTHRNPVQFVEVKFLEEFIKKHPYDSDQLSDVKTINNVNNKAKTFLNSFERKTSKKKITDAWGRKSSYTKLYEPEPDPFRYHPNYNSIYKNVPCCRIAPLKVQLIKNKKLNRKIKKYKYSDNNSKENNSIDKNNNKNKNKILENLILNNTNNTKTITIKNNERVSKTLPAVRKNKKFSRNNIDKNNHAFKFSDYMPRKDNIMNTNKIISYIEPHDYSNIDKKKVIDFGKMEDRGKKSALINYASLSIPSASYYNPKYELTDQRPTQILFTHQNIIDANKKSNKYLIRKLWTSYNVKLLYQLIDNDKLKKKS